MSKILCITGSHPPDVCGVGDYTKRLVDSSDEFVCLYLSSDWSLGSFFSHVKRIKSTGIVSVNLQYPTQGYGWSVVPHLLCIYFSLFSKTVFSVTVHEHSQLTKKARWALKLILYSANKLVFTNEFERIYATSFYSGVKRKSKVIKIFSNIKACKDIKPIASRGIDVLYFGHIRPKKGIEKFINDAAQLPSHLKVCLMGQVPAGFESYYQSILDQAKGSGVRFFLNVEENEVASMLNDTKLVYLPFPDGASERRGSVLAAMANGAVVMTTLGEFTTSALEDAVINLTSIDLREALADKALLKQKQQQSMNFIKNEMPHGWGEVVSDYLKFLK